MADPILSDALFSGWNWQPGQVLTFRFQSAGVTVDRGGYAGGDSLTTGWTDAQMRQARQIFADVERFTNLSTREVASGQAADIRLAMVNNVPGGWAGYAEYPDRDFGSDLTIGDAYTHPRDNTLVHELGHALGLKHPHEDLRYPGVDGSNDSGDFGLNTGTTTVMSYNWPYWRDGGFEIRGDLTDYMAADIAALQALYGTDTDTARGRDVYRDTGALICIWDAGGRDRIDFSDTGRATVIDLRAATLEAAPGGGGWLSYIARAGGPLGGYTIARGVVIEDATGGTGRDRIAGNGAGNTLAGNGDNDRLSGLGGNDVLTGGAGADRLDGGRGDDTLDGGGGSDTFIFDGGRDRVRAFADNADTIVISAALSRGYRSADALLDDVARTADGAVILDFGGGDVLRISGISRIAALTNDLDLG
jgi:Ca2+-binding RTX toxin-like protein